MSNTGVQTFDASSPDPSLDLLVPRSRSWHAPALVAGGLALLACTWFSSGLLHPQLWTGSGGGSAGLVTPADGPASIVTTTSNRPSSWSGFDVVAVEDVPGAHVTGSWLLLGDSPEEGRVPEHPSSVEAYLAAAIPALGDDDKLPVRVPGGTQNVTLVVAWQIDDCTALQGWADAAASLGTDGTAPRVRLRTVLGTTLTGSAAPFAGPDFAGDWFGGPERISQLRDNGACPGPGRSSSGS